MEEANNCCIRIKWDGEKIWCQYNFNQSFCICAGSFKNIIFLGKNQSRSFCLFLYNPFLTFNILSMVLFFQRTYISGFDPEYTYRRTPVLMKNNIENCLWLVNFGKFSQHPMRDAHWGMSTNHRGENFEKGFGKHF